MTINFTEKIIAHSGVKSLKPKVNGGVEIDISAAKSSEATTLTVDELVDQCVAVDSSTGVALTLPSPASILQKLKSMGDNVSLTDEYEFNILIIDATAPTTIAVPEGGTSYIDEMTTTGKKSIFLKFTDLTTPTYIVY
ncbi:MAG: hypothetical protein ACOCRK_00655 [bacterium]